ncbi:MAG: aspartate 1-decarboxylase [Wenzhouxiangella sp.]|nr:MAG: aspartate 1-decarboxylase [Wenzhouxiangella sp.]
MLKAKIHRATVTDADLNYEGSITIDSALCRAAGLVEFEQVDVYDIDNGQRFTTYVILGGDGEICVNGAAARLVHRGDKVIIASYCQVADQDLDQWHPTLVMVNPDNGIASVHRPPVRRP